MSDTDWDAEVIATHLCNAIDGQVDEVTEVMEDMRSGGYFFDVEAGGRHYSVLVTDDLRDWDDE